MHVLQKMQGIHAPLRLHMEKQAVKDVGHLPCLYRHNALADALTGNLRDKFRLFNTSGVTLDFLGRDVTLEFEDFLNTPLNSESAAHPHVVVDRHLGIF